MARFGVFLLLALAAIAQATLPTNNAQEAVQAILRRQNVSDQKAKPLCKECEKIVMLLKKILDNPNVEQKLKVVLTDVCNLPALSNFKSTCMDLLVNDIIVVIHQLQSILDDPTKFCGTIRLCESEAPGVNTVSKRLFLSVVSKIVQDVQRPSPLMAIDTCGLCTSALDELKRWLEVPQIIEKIQDETEKVCKYLGIFEQTCDNLIQNWFPKLFGWLVDALCDPQQTCTAVHLCKKQTSLLTNMFPISRVPAAVSHPHLDRFLANITAFQVSQGFDIKCATCKTSIGAALKILSKDSVLTSLAKDITDLVCKILPSSQKDGCFDFLGIYGKAALQLTVTEWTPAEICTSMHACSSASAKHLEALSLGEESKLVCDACKALSKVLAAELQKPELQQEIINILTKGCMLLPGKYSFKCQSFVQTYVPYVMDDIVALSMLPKLCTVLHAC